MKSVKQARNDSRLATLNVMLGWRDDCWESASVQATFYFRDKRRRDRDNLLASLKAYFDGLADSGLIANDSGLTHLPVKVELDKVNPRVVLTVTPS
jgi:Holliday junction resolvase RusA-like endonuclease